MGDKTSGYVTLKTVFHDKDLLDVSNTEDGGTSYDESQRVELDTFITYLGTVIKNLYNLDGTLLADRTITAATFFTKWIDGDVIVNTGELTERGFTVNAFNDVERARLSFNQALQSGELSLTDDGGEWLNSSGRFTSLGAATAFAGSQLGIKAPNNSNATALAHFVNASNQNVMDLIAEGTVRMGVPPSSSLGTANVSLQTISPHLNAYYAQLSNKLGDISGLFVSGSSGAAGAGGTMSGIKSVLSSTLGIIIGGNHLVLPAANAIASYGIFARNHITSLTHTGTTYGGFIQNALVGTTSVSNVTYGVVVENKLTAITSGTATKMIGGRFLCNVNSVGTATDVTALEVEIINTGTITNTPVVASFLGGNMGVGIAVPVAIVDVLQSDPTGALPVIKMEQLDLSEEFIDFTGTAAIGNPIEAVGAKTLTTTHFLKVTINGATRYIPAGTIA